ncbi:MAG: DUF6249 domain-containing protein [Pseudomonadota bacterium]|uniref:DUF6249 domain-containing protein n=1 Tax=unclassified Phenylobacterium TaxID=2640670 RepID=UPI0006FF39E4|nr:MULTISPECIES: DUF6249 domain-containing protein [unclassified Phenylobacterium]KRB39930.1 hypothetical protein ASE02_09020 [Phenylobacterium sp. Root700]MBT9469570.1 hypothetical protein [Phenylobacterium sp.]
MEILVPLGFFAMIAAIVIVPRYLKSLERQRLQETLRASIEKGAELPPEVIEALTSDVKKAPASSYRDLRAGVIWLGVAVAFIALGVAVSFEEPDALYPLLGIAAFPGFIGLALIALSFVQRDRR